MKAEQLDDIFESGADLLPHLDLSTVRRPNLEQKRVNVDLPIWMIENLDREPGQRTWTERRTGWA